MEKNNKESLALFAAEIEDLKERLASLEARFAKLSESLPEEDEKVVEDDDPGIVDIDIVDLPVPEIVPGKPEEEFPAEDDLPEDIPAEEIVPAEEVAVPAEEVVVTVEAPTELLAPTGSYPWQTAKPGMPVKNLRSGISLFDRALFINTLFKEDYVLYDKTISDLNALSSFPEAVDYILRHFPDWNLSSDVVYSFMMALRKKLL